MKSGLSFLTFVLAGICGALTCSSAYAYKVTPLILQLEPVGPKAKGEFDVVNNHGFPLTLEFSAVERSVADDGVETDTPADDAFLIFPPQSVVPAGKTQRVRVQYLGGPLETSKAYRVITRQVPVRDASGQPKVEFNYTFKSAIYVSPKGSAFEIEVGAISGADGGYDVVVSNKGNRHVVLSTGPWTATDGAGKGAEIDLEKTSVKKSPLLEPGQTRTFFISRDAVALDDISKLEIEPLR